MAYEVTQRARSEFSKTLIEPNLVLKIRGVDELFGVEVIKVDARFGENGLHFGDPGLTFGGLARVLNAANLIALNGTSTDISQQLEPDKGAVTSVQSLKVRLVDLSEKITQLISPGVTIEEILYSFCQVYLGPKESSFPEDYIELFNGNIQSAVAGSGFVDFTIVHPEDKKRSEIFPKIETVLVEPCEFNSLVVQDLLFQAFGDIIGLVEIRFINAASGDNASVSVVGQQITVGIDPANTRLRTVKRELENDPNSNQIISVSTIEGGSLNTIAQVTAGFLPLVTDTEVVIEDAQFLPLPVGDIFRTYVKINDEIIEYSSIDYNTNTLLGCTRASLSSFGATHEIDDTVESFYKLGDATQENGNAVNLALWLMLSGADEYFETELPVESIVKYSGTLSIPNAIFLKSIDAARDLGLTVGDIVDCYDAMFLDNNFNARTIVEIGTTDSGSYIVVDGVALVVEEDTPAQLRLKSQYNILPDGLGLSPFQVDIERFLEIQSLYFSSIALYEFYLKDTQNAKSLINEKIFLPSAMYSVPRKGRISVGFTAPPLFNKNSKQLGLNEVKNPDQLKIERSTTKNFYNSVVYRFNEDSVTDRFLSGRIEISADSVNRIKIPNQPLTIDANGLRPSGQTALLIERNSLRFLNRYQYGAEKIQVEVPFNIGWDTEVGDPIVLGGQDLQISDINNGTRNFSPRIFEITNKRLNWRTGFISLELTDTSFNQQVRFGVFSPASILDAGSTTTSLKITNSFGTRLPNIEKDKWTFYIGKQVIVHSEDWSFNETTKLLSFDASDDFRN